MVCMAPLASILRPKQLSGIIGQDHLVGEGKIFHNMVTKKVFNSTILWGPPGTGKTSIVRAMANDSGSQYFQLNATEATVKDIRTVISTAGKEKSRRNFAFIDEIHRFSKSQQDVLLPAVEDGTIVLFGATTENPVHSVNSTILSRCLVLETKPFSSHAAGELIIKVRNYYKAQNKNVTFDADAVKYLIMKCSGDARKLITVLETVIEVLSDGHVTLEHAQTALPSKHLVFDATGNEHFDLAHCVQEAVQNSDADGAIYWLAKWICSGEDPTYICRRLLITAFEDCAGNPNAWLAAMSACFAAERTGLPECQIPMALAVCEMAKSERNKAAYHAIKEAINDVKNGVTIHVPPSLRAGTSGYDFAITKRYLKDWKRDAAAT